MIGSIKKCDAVQSYTVKQPNETFKTIAENLLAKEMNPPFAPSPKDIEAKAKELAELNQLTDSQLFPGLQIFFPLCRYVHRPLYPE